MKASLVPGCQVPRLLETKSSRSSPHLVAAILSMLLSRAMGESSYPQSIEGFQGNTEVVF
jgi:hypothetical protein